jgi:signal peptidase I
MEKKRDCPKEPWLAVVLLSLLMGIGQIFSGRVLRGIILLLIEIALYCSMIWSVLSPKCDILITAGLVLFLLAIRIWNLFDAHKCARKTNPEEFETERKQGKNPWLALFLSDLLPGLGQLYLKKWLWGIGFTIATVLVFSVCIKYKLLFFGLWAVFSTFICYHAYISAPVRREKSNSAILIIAIAILCYHLLGYHRPLFRAYVVEAFRIPTGGMKPTLVPGDRFLVRKGKKYVPKRGDVVIFKSPDDPDIRFVQRIAGLPGETIKIKDKILYIDGRKVQWPTIENTEDLPGKFGVVAPYKAPENCFFVLGDNIANSRDSRFFGAIPQRDLIGKAYKIYWPIGRNGPIE